MKKLRIVFSGSPHSGKSTVLNALKDRLNPAKKNDWKVFFVEEGATYILSTGQLSPQIDPIGFQKAVLQFQLLHEQCIEHDESHCNLLLLADRGIADAHIYVEHEASSILGESLERSLKRYDTVLYFQPFHGRNTKAGNKYRYETEQQLRLLEEKTADVWKKHQNVVVIPNFETIGEKVNYVVEVLNQILEEEVFI